MQTQMLGASIKLKPATGKHHRDLYFELLRNLGAEHSRQHARELLQQQLLQCRETAPPIPTDPATLQAWIVESSREAGLQYQAYLQERQQGAPRRYFSSKAHALYFIKHVAPTKMVDGSWLYGLLPYWNDPAYAALIDIYLEELGDGVEAQNHVSLYRKLLRTHGAEQWTELPAEYFTQGAIQLALASVAEEYLPEVVGFNLAYEQLPLHLLITAAELDELNIDPYYFTLHITIDNALSGHAVKAAEAVSQLLPRYGSPQEVQRRMINGARLSNCGLGTLDIINAFNLEEEVIQIMRDKATLGQFMHNHHCRIGGRGLHEWLADPQQIPGLLQALQDGKWIMRHQPPSESRFWKLIDGEQGQMFGVFSAYEKQVLFDWIAGDALESLPKRERLGPSWRVQQREAAKLASAPTAANHPGHDSPNVIPLPTPKGQEKTRVEHSNSQELRLFQQQVDAVRDKPSLMRLLSAWMAPSLHDTPAGLAATRMFKAEMLN